MSNPVLLQQNNVLDTAQSPLDLSARDYRLAYQPPYDFGSMLAFLRSRALPGIELVDEISYSRAFGPAESPGWLRLRACTDGSDALHLTTHGADHAQATTIVTRVRRMFDLDAAPQVIGKVLGKTAPLRAMVRRHPGLRLPGSWDGFEVAVRAVLGQQVSVAAARTLASRIVHQHGEILRAPMPAGLERIFPAADVMVDADLRALGITTARANCIRGIARALLDGSVDFRVDQSLEQFVSRWIALPGIGEWTAHYMAMRALSHPDAFPAADLILRRAAAPGADALSTKALTTSAEAWRPWRAYAVIHLWRSTSDALPLPRKATKEKP